MWQNLVAAAYNKAKPRLKQSLNYLAVGGILGCTSLTPPAAVGFHLILPVSVDWYKALE